jgi:hypothetical protein
VGSLSVRELRERKRKCTVKGRTLYFLYTYINNEQHINGTNYVVIYAAVNIYFLFQHPIYKIYVQ